MRSALTFPIIFGKKYKIYLESREVMKSPKVDLHRSASAVTTVRGSSRVQ
jgi:hypothetical protein